MFYALLSNGTIIKSKINFTFDGLWSEEINVEIKHPTDVLGCISVENFTFKRDSAIAYWIK